MSATPAGDALCARARPRARRNAVVVVAEPRIAIVEGPDLAEPSAFADALVLLVAWAMRGCAQPQAQQRLTEAGPSRPAVHAEPAIAFHTATYAPED